MNKIERAIQEFIDNAFHPSLKPEISEQSKALALVALREKQERKQLPKIVCLCGSTRFFKTFEEQNLRLTLEGKIVLSIGCNTKSDEGLNLTAADKEKLDELHKRKIDLCDSVLVLNVDGYIGESTQSEIEYADKLGKPIEYLIELKEGAEK